MNPGALETTGVHLPGAGVTGPVSQLTGTREIKAGASARAVCACNC